MKIFKKNHLAFTLIEVIVAVTILTIILVSVMQIYISSADINVKIDITRALQQNVKSAVEVIAEDVRKNGFTWVSANSTSSCELPIGPNLTGTGTKLCTSQGYYLAKEISGVYSRVPVSECDEIIEKCTLVRDGQPLMNSWVDVKDLQFYISDNGVKKVTILMTLQPAQWKWIRPNLIANNRFYFQTTLSERPDLN